MNKKPFRERVAEHYLKTGKSFTYLDIAHDFAMSEKVASHCFCGIMLAKRYRVAVDKAARPYSMRVLHVIKRNATPASIARDKVEAEPKKERDREVSNLMRAWGGVL